MAACFAGGVALFVVLFPHRGDNAPQNFNAAPAQLVKTERSVALSARDRREIDRLLDRFVPAATTRVHAESAYSLATPSLRAGTSRSDWARGDVPVSPFPGVIADRSFHAWAVNYSFRNSADLDLLVHAKGGSKVTGVSYDVGLKRIGGRWLVDSILERQQYAAASPPPPPASRVAAPRGSSTKTAAAPAKSGHSGIWLIVPAAMLLVPVLGLASVALLRWRRARAAERLYRVS